MSKTSKKELAKDYVNRFKKNFYNLFKTHPQVRYSLKFVNNSVTINEVIDITNDILAENGITDLKDGILNKSREEFIILHRQISCKICRDLGYSYSEIGKAHKINHATVIHSCKKVKDSLDLNYTDTVKVHDQVYQAVNNLSKLKQDGSIPAENN